MARHAPRVQDNRITATHLTRQQLIESDCDIPWAEQVQGILYEHPDWKLIHVSYLDAGTIKTIANDSFEDLRKTVADLNERHRRENPAEYK
jgi:hypothetical protein